MAIFKWDTGSVKSDEWFSHFSNCSGKPLNKSERDIKMQKYVAENIDSLESELDFTFTNKELLHSIQKLKKQ